VAWRAAAEEVRAHLVALRGGAPFLSPSDAWQLVQWLENGVSVGDVLLALERAAEARRRQRGRTPLTLGAAKRHLGKPAYPRATAWRAAPEPTVAGEPPLAPIARALRGQEADGSGAAEDLATALERIEERDAEAERQAIAAIRTFVETRWLSLGEPRRDALRSRAREDLGDLLALVDEPTGLALVEETARDLFRQSYPWLTVASVRSFLA